MASHRLQCLQALELELHRPETRGNHDRLSQLLHPQFLEHGRSGAVYTQREVIAQLSTESTETKIHAQAFVLHELAPNVILLTYQSAIVAASGALERHTNRASVWRLETSGWQMLFHQGTPTQPFAQLGTSTNQWTAS